MASPAIALDTLSPKPPGTQVLQAPSPIKRDPEDGWETGGYTDMRQADPAYLGMGGHRPRMANAESPTKPNLGSEQKLASPRASAYLEPTSLPTFPLPTGQLRTAGHSPRTHEQDSG